jgi:hypothetical protein
MAVVWTTSDHQPSGYFLTTQNSRVCSETTMETLDFQKLIEHIYKKLLAKSRDIDEYLTIDALKWEAICSGLRQTICYWLKSRLFRIAYVITLNFSGKLEQNKPLANQTRATATNHHSGGKSNRPKGLGPRRW